MTIRVENTNTNTMVELQKGTFPDGTQIIKVLATGVKNADVTIHWNYRSDDELVTLMFLKSHLDNLKAKVTLNMPYIPNARYDRVTNENEVFTLKYFANIINSMKFEKVIVLDPHSNVSAALIDNIEQADVSHYIQDAYEDARRENNLVLFMPDEGAHKRYSDMINKPSTFGIKHRNWETGTILSYEVAEKSIVEGNDILIVDDISSRGGTFAHAAKALKDAGAKRISLYVTHCEKTIEKGELLDEDSLIDQIYTADALFDRNNFTTKLNKIKQLKG